LYDEDVFAKAVKSMKLNRPCSVAEARKKLGASGNAIFLIGSCDDRLELAAVFFALGSKVVPKAAEPGKDKKEAPKK